MELKAFKTDRKLRDEGVWVPLPGRPNEEAEVKVRSEDYAPYRRALSRIVEETQSLGRFSRKNQGGMRLGDPVRFDQERGRAIAKHLLVDWRGFKGEGFTDDGSEIKFSPELAEKFLTHEDYRDFYLAVDEAINSLGKAKEVWEDDRKNDSASDSSTI